MQLGISQNKVGCDLHLGFSRLQCKLLINNKNGENSMNKVLTKSNGKTALIALAVVIAFTYVPQAWQQKVVKK